MKLLQFIDPQDGQHVGFVSGGEVIDLTRTRKAPRSLYDIYYNLGGDEIGLAAAVSGVGAETGNEGRLNLKELLENRNPRKPYLVKPVSGPDNDPYALRVWLAGVTHEDSARLREMEARQATGDSVNVYDQKYRECAGGGRPELFPKNDPDAVVGHGQPIMRPADTERLVPETELVSVYGMKSNGQVERLGYTGGNDVTDNGMEAANPLNLPQAKNWAAGCASLGPLLVTADDYDDRVVGVSCEVLRNGQRIAFKSGETGRDRLNMPDKLLHMERTLFRRIPLQQRQLQVLYWGTPVVFSEADLEGGLLVGDTVRMTFSGGIGILENPIAELGVIDQLKAL